VSGFNIASLTNILIPLICFIPAIVLHELGHGFVANRLGDPTAKRMGRLTLNPIKHVDPFGTVILPIVLAIFGGPVFGYAKPVPYNPSYFKNLKVGEVLTGLAGPAMNLVLALLTSLVGFILFQTTNMPYDVANWVFTILYLFAYINLILMFFNLIPLPPLDGSSIIVPFLPRTALPTWYKIQRYAMPILFVVIFILPYFLHVNPLGAYLQVTAGNLLGVLFPYIS